MPKSTNKDIENISDGNSPAAAPEVKPKRTRSTSADGAAKKPRSPRKSAAAAAVVESTAVATADDAELQSLLLQVDKMLTEMTQSKWLSSDWPSLEIDFSNDQKK